jgi:DICT domain-containing protein
MWERRYGFPSPPRRPGRHRRYRERDVERVLTVNRLRLQGLSLTAAINRARQASDPPPASLFASLRRLHPEVQAAVLTKPALLALSWAIEDEYCAHGGGGLLLASFQRERFYRLAERRWRELARSAEVAVAMADFAALGEPADAPVEVPIEAEQPLSREWTLVVDAPVAHACLAAWEQPSQAALPDERRRFEVLWSFDPRVVRSSSAVAAELIRRPAPVVAERIEQAITEFSPPAEPEFRFANSLANRIVGYLAGAGGGGSVSAPAAAGARRVPR